MPAEPLLTRRALGALSGLAALTALGCGGGGYVPEPGTLTVTAELSASWSRNFHPLLASGGRWPTSAGIYEPLLIHNPMTGEVVPWLATGYRWSEDASQLRLTIREGVRWSDGTPFTPEDVVYTFQLMREQPAFDPGALWSFLSDVTLEQAGAPGPAGGQASGPAEGDAGARTDAGTAAEAGEPAAEAGPPEVVISFERPFVPGFARVVQTPIVPAHIWRTIEDPVEFANPDPVGTGPFTEVLQFAPQQYSLGRNPDYWRDDIAIERLVFPAFPTNEQANIALIRGEVDWAGTFVPAIDRIYVERDPDNHGYWFPQAGGSIFLYANTTRQHFGDERVRKAISLALDRERIVAVAMYEYTQPSNETALAPGFTPWFDETALPAEGEGWVDHDLARAAALLDEAGFRLNDEGQRMTPEGEPLSWEVAVVAGWSDWVRAARLIGEDLSALGIEARMRTYDFGAWLERMQRGEFELSIGWGERGETPFDYYRGLASSETLEDVGTTALTNWHRYQSPAMDRLLTTFEHTTDPVEQRNLARAMQRVFVEEAPAIPLFLAPSWGEFNRSRFEGWPSAEDPYAPLTPYRMPQALLVMTRLRPRDGATAARETR